jgi:hypothetical protein
MIAWGTFSGTPNFPADYVPALACLDDDVNGTTVMPTIPNVAPFNDGTYPAATYPQYQVGQTAQMCVSNAGWTAVKDPAGFPAGFYVQPWFKIIDRSDGYVRLP